MWGKKLAITLQGCTSSTNPSASDSTLHYSLPRPSVRLVR